MELKQLQLPSLAQLDLINFFFISVLKIFTNNTMAQQKRSADGSQAGIVAQSEGLKL